MEPLDPSPHPSDSLRFSIRKALSPAFALEVAAELLPGITVLFGASGSGKTTLLKCLAGLIEPDAGKIALADQVNSTVTRRIGMVFQNLALFPHLSAGENIAYGLHDLAVTERRAKVSSISTAFRIEHTLHRRPAQLSGGEQQRVALARTLVTEPRALLLDEPLTALDPGTKALIMDDLRNWIAERQIPVLYVTHSREEVFAMAQRVIALENGRIVGEGSPREVLGAALHEAVAEWSALENILSGTITAIHEAQGTMTFGAGNIELEVPLGRAQIGDPARVGVSAHDILLATVPPQGLSARNVLPGRIVELKQRDAVVSVTVDCRGAALTVYVTPASVETLALQAGGELWVVIKTHSCFLIRP